MNLPDFYVPLLPRRRHLHRCVQCGFLGQANPDGQIVTLAPDDRLHHSRVGAHCYLHVVSIYDLAEPHLGTLLTKAGLTDLPADQHGTELRALAYQAAITNRIFCPFFMRLKPGLSPEAHERLRERQLDATQQITAALAGGFIALLGTALALLLG
jgi:hypothetical protein